MGFSALKRAETDASTNSFTSSVEYEKGTLTHREYAPENDAIKEEDEDNVGEAEYKKSQEQAEIVSILPSRKLILRHDTDFSRFFARRLPRRTRLSSAVSIGAFSLSS